MAHRVARPARYQGGASFNIFSAQGSNPTSDCKVCGKGVQKLYDKSVKTYVYSLYGGPSSKLQLPKDENKTGLQLFQPFVVFQIFVPARQPLAFELRVTDTTNTRRKMYFSTSFSDIKSTPLHCQIPITMITRNTWLSFSIHVADLFTHCFKGERFKSVDTIVLGPVCKLRKIFTMRNRLSNIGSLSNSFDANSEDYLPQEHMFALGVDNVIQVLDMKAIQTTIIDLSNPSNEEDTLKLQKVKIHKMESRQVHVAFGSRMPLPLSTIQINTNLPGDNEPHLNKAFPKDRERIDRARKSIYSQIEIPSSMSKHNQIGNKVENKSEALKNLLTHANNFNKNHAMMKLKKDQALLDQSKLLLIDEAIERPHNVHLTTQKLQLSPNLMITDASKQTQKPKEAGIEGIMALTSLIKDDMMNMLSKEDPTITHLQWSSNEIHPKQTPQSTSLSNEASNNEARDSLTNKVVLKEPPIFVPKTIEEYKSPNPIIGLGKYVRKVPHIDCNKRKENKQSRYMDSPPESPPCGWTSCIEDDNEENPLKIPSLFSKICANMDDLERSKDSIDNESTITSNSHLMDSLDLEDEIQDERQCIQEGVQKLFGDEDANYDYSSEDSHTEQSMKVKSTSKNDINFMKDRPKPPQTSHEKFDHGNNLVFHDSETMPNEDCSFGRHSWSSNDHSPCEQDGDKLLMIDTKASKNLCDTLQELKAFQNDDDHNENLRLSSRTIRPQSRTSFNDRKISTCCEDALYGMFTSSSNSVESISKVSTSSFTLKNESENVKEVNISNCITEHKDAGITTNNGRPDEDLDLLYDPTLDCYYDPKTNRYYELK